MKLYKILGLMRGTEQIKVVSVGTVNCDTIYQGLARNLPAKFESLDVIDFIGSRYYGDGYTFYIDD